MAAPWSGVLPGPVSKDRVWGVVLDGARWQLSLRGGRTPQVGVVNRNPEKRLLQG